MGIYVAVPQDRFAVIESFGKFQRVASPGFHFLTPFASNVAGHINTRLQQIIVTIGTKTKDNVFVSVVVAVQFRVIQNEECLYSAYYKLSTPAHQIQSYVEDVVRSAVPALELDHLFVQKQHIAQSIFRELETAMQSFGYQIVAALVIDVAPDKHVKDEMNEINVSRRRRAAQAELAEALKFTDIKKAEAEAEKAYLQGEGLARERRAIVEGMKDSVNELAKSSELAPKEVMQMMLVTQYFDTLKDVGQGEQTSVVFAPKHREARSKVKVAVAPEQSNSSLSSGALIIPEKQRNSPKSLSKMESPRASVVRVRPYRKNPLGRKHQKIDSSSNAALH